MPQVILNKTRKKRLEQGHAWIYRNELERVEGDPEPGALVQVLDHRGKYLATGYYNPHSQITVRVIAYQPVEAMDERFFEERIQACLDHRSRFLENTDSYRLVYGEADFLPGLIVDKFADVLVIQLLTLGMDRCREAIVRALVKLLQPKAIYERSDVPVRELEGLQQTAGELYGECPQQVEIMENGIRLRVDVKNGQKTGYFFDQRENRARLRPLMRGWGRRSGITLQQRDEDGQVASVPVNANGKKVTFPYWDGATVLECFAHTGSFTLHACHYGAKRVTCLDVSEQAIEQARENVLLNGFAERVEFVVEDAFHYLRNQVRALEERERRALASRQKVDTSIPLENKGKTWDVVVLDPPAFAKSKSAIKGALRGYKDINLHGMKLVNEGGYLVTASCSSPVSPEMFLDTIQSAAADAGKLLRLIEFRGAGADHPRLAAAEETHYLKFAIFEVTSRRK
ncbi:class I SAM-dependent rRNA methyltransferase [Paenibacillus senegalensis]|uniref:class I SAM-dependent rRNA methyltransferase n=1 Tax=Paenibacillus senegalensis TaxID=1465766 RepID=UPI0002889E21|nr:class I SAM-dependent rRNA methyltransferase [Paenibacillus senegalensis]